MRPNSPGKSSVILLEHPRPKDPTRFQDVVNAPLCANLLIPYIAALLKAERVPAEILDANLMGWSMERTVGELSKRSPQLLGVHTVYFWDKTREIFDMLSTFRKFCPHTHISLFGFYPTFSYNEILKRFPFIDSVIVGEPEYTFLELAKQILASTEHRSLESIDCVNGHLRESSSSLPNDIGVRQTGLHEKRPLQESQILSNLSDLGLSNVEGLAFAIDSTTGRKVIKNKLRPLFSNLDCLPFPDRSHLQQHKKHGIATYILGSRGCYARCTFCCINPFYGDGWPWRGRSAENIFEEIRALYDGLGVRYFYFADANFFGPGGEGKERALKLADLIISNGLRIKFGMECRANDIEERSLSRLVQAGLSEVFLGIESGCQHVLNQFKKGVSTEMNIRAVETLRRCGIEPSLGFIMFRPDSRLTDIRENFEFLKRLKLLRTPAVTAHILHHRQTFFRGTPEFSYALNRPGTVLEPLTGYEALCTFDDPNVAAFYEVAASLCRSVLGMLRPEDADVCNISVSNGRLGAINDAVVTAYGRLLSMFEDGGVVRGASLARRICDESLRHVCSMYGKVTS